MAPLKCFLASWEYCLKKRMLRWIIVRSQHPPDQKHRVLTKHALCGIRFYAVERAAVAVRWIISTRLHFFLGASMYILYLDDSGSTDNSNEEYLILGGVSVYERQVKFLTQKLDELAKSILPGDPDSVEFHAYEIFAGKNPPWDRILSKDERKGIINRVLDILSDSHYSVHAFACAVHKGSFPGKDPMELAFQDLCSRFDMQLSRLWSDGKQNKGLIILDKSAYETSLQNLSLKFKTEGTVWRQLKHVTEVPLFVNSKSSRLVQLADHVAYSVFRRYEHGDANYFDRILGRFDSEGGTLHGLAHKHHSDSQCMCQACMSRRLAPRTRQ
jgi:hypothetical protein